LLLPALKKAAPSRILQVNSEGHRFAGVRLRDLNFRRRIYTGLRGYGASKTAQLLTMWEMAKELEGTGVTINAVHPGAVRSNIGQNSGPLYRFWLNHILWHFLKDPSVSGRALYYLAAAPELESTSGRFYNLTIEEPPARHARMSAKGRTLYTTTKKLVGLSEKEGDVHDL
jgi:NAD(P)-dependent dehydrogenase (short-subunit alcohol dehydrogenase family)